EPHRSARPGSDMTKYLVISSDGHAGPPAEVYRGYLDASFRQQFDEHQAALDAGRMVNAEFVEEWDEETGDYEMRAAFDPAVRDRVLDQEGLAAEVLFPDADVLGTGRLASSPFGSGLGSGADADPEAVKAGARAPVPPTIPSGLGSSPSTPPSRGGGRPAPSGSSFSPACSNAIRRCGTRSPRTAPGGCPTSSSAWTRSGSGATTPASSATSSNR